MHVMSYQCYSWRSLQLYLQIVMGQVQDESQQPTVALHMKPGNISTEDITTVVRQTKKIQQFNACSIEGYDLHLCPLK